MSCRVRELLIFQSFPLSLASRVMSFWVPCKCLSTCVFKKMKIQFGKETLLCVVKFKWKINCIIIGEEMTWFVLSETQDEC